jgi:hypothetical protein
VTERLIATGVRMFLASELPSLAVGIQLSPVTSEQRMERRAEQRGELIFVAAGAFADLEADGRTGRLWSTFRGKHAVRLDEDPTSQLIEFAEACRDDLRYNLQHDLRYGGEMDLTRWEFYAAPFTVELSPLLRERLGAAWSERAPRQLPGESEPAP